MIVNRIEIKTINELFFCSQVTNNPEANSLLDLWKMNRTVVQIYVKAQFEIDETFQSVFVKTQKQISFAFE